MTAGPDVAVSAEVAVRYEDLGRHILDGGGSRPRLGLAVLVREGVAAWITTCAMVSYAMAPAPDPSDGAVLRLADGVHGDLVHVLAAMALHRLERGHGG